MTQALPVQWLARELGADLVGRTDVTLRGVLPLADATGEHLSFYANPRYHAALEASAAGAVLVSREQAQTLLHRPGTPERAWLLVPDPALAATRAAALFRPAAPAPTGIHPTAVVDPTATLGANVSVGPHAVVEAQAQLGNNCCIDAQTFVGRAARLGDNVHLCPGARVLADCVVGPRSILYAGSVVGSDGFGYQQDRTTRRWTKVPQLGNAVLGADVELGANATVDRATFGSTTVGDGCKIDNLVMVGHNVQIGRDCVLVAQTGVAGSTRLGQRVVAGAQSGFVGHLSVADDCQFAARSGITKSVDKTGTYGGMPVLPHRKWLQSMACLRQLDQMRRDLAQLQRAPADPSAKRAEERS